MTIFNRAIAALLSDDTPWSLDDEQPLPDEPRPASAPRLDWARAARGKTGVPWLWYHQAKRCWVTQPPTGKRQSVSSTDLSIVLAAWEDATGERADRALAVLRERGLA